MDIIAYAAANGYTDETVVGGGAIKGKNCTIKSIVHRNGRNTVTFQWILDDGTEKSQQMIVYDGTPIYDWVAGDTYKVGNIAIYASSFYKCIVQNSDNEFDPSKWNEISASDGNYGIVESADLLPDSFGAEDRKMFYSIEDEAYWLWNGLTWALQRTLIQYLVIPTASSVFRNRIIQYIGPTTEHYIHGRYYECDGNEWTLLSMGETEELTPEQVAQIIQILNR